MTDQSVIVKLLFAADYHVAVIARGWPKVPKPVIPGGCEAANYDVHLHI
jgi:hypothetical protein